MPLELLLMDITFLSAIVPHIDSYNIQNLRFDFHLFLLFIWCLTKYISFVRITYKKKINL